MQWQTEEPEPIKKPYSVSRSGNSRLSVNEYNGCQWQHFQMSFGEFSDEPHDECLKTWPREALRLAREQLDRLEAKLDEDSE